MRSTQLDRWSAVCFVFSSTGLFLMAISFTLAWYDDGDISYSIINHPTSLAFEVLAVGIFFWWIFMATSVLQPSLLRAVLGWLAVALTTVSLAAVAWNNAPLFGWALGVFALLLLAISVVSDLNRAFFLEKKEPEIPFANE